MGKEILPKAKVWPDISKMIILFDCILKMDNNVSDMFYDLWRVTNKGLWHVNGSRQMTKKCLQLRYRVTDYVIKLRWKTKFSDKRGYDSMIGWPLGLWNW